MEMAEGDIALITISAMKWAPPFATGSVRDYRARWILNEVGWPYRVHLVDAPELASASYGKQQPFGQVPYMEENGRPTLFETGAIVIDVATRAGKLIPIDDAKRSLVLCWVVAALNSMEPSLMNVAEVEFFIEDKVQRDARRPSVVTFALKRLGQLDEALGDRQWLVGNEFTIADLMMASVLRLADMQRMIKTYPRLFAYRERCLDRPAYQKAVAEQRATIADHQPADMRYDQVEG